MLLQSKKPHPKPNRTNPATAIAAVDAFPTLNKAGRNMAIPSALTKIRPRLLFFIHLSAR